VVVLCCSALRVCGHRELHWSCGCTGASQGARIQSHFDGAEPEEYVTHCSFGSQCVLAVAVMPCWLSASTVNQLGDAGAQALAKALELNSSLLMLNVSSTYLCSCDWHSDRCLWSVD
jgi:hypothetical protein